MILVREMIDIAKQNVLMLIICQLIQNQICIILFCNASSVFHEIHTYSSDIEWDYGNILIVIALYILQFVICFIPSVPVIQQILSS